MLAAGKRLGPYEVLDVIGAGGMGEVYRGRDTRLDRDVAIKVLPLHLSGNPDFKQRFEREARVISSLNHPNICTLHDVGNEEGLDFLVMELCEGVTLADRLEKGPLPTDQVLRYAIQMADALDRAHRSGITHRDLKPGNIMLTKSGAKLLDFGLAKGGAPPPSAAFEGATVAKPLTQEGTILGTFQYMAPEQLGGEEPDPRTDIFAFGAMLYEMITGKRAFEGKTKASLIVSILDREPQPLSALQPLIPPALERVVQTCLAKDPDDRWQSAHDLKRELEWIRDGVSSPSAGTAAAPRKRSAPNRAAWVAVVVLPILAALGTWLWMWAATPPPRKIVSAIAPPRGMHIVVTGDVAGPVTLSPDGRYAVFLATNGQDSQLWLQSLETGSTTPLPGTQRAMFPFWSPDSRSIGFFAAGHLMSLDIDGSAPRVIADAPDGRGGAWTSDGQIVYTPYTQSGIFRVAASGGTPVAVTNLQPPYSTHRWPAILRDGKHFVYLAASHARAGSDTALFLASLDGAENRMLMKSLGNAVPWRDSLLYLQGDRLVARRLKDGALVGQPVEVWDHVLYDPGTWRSIFSISSNGLLATQTSVSKSGWHMEWLDRAGKMLSEITPQAPWNDVAISPDGKRVAVTVGDPTPVLYLQDVASGVRTRFSFVEGAAFFPLWTPDGRNVVFGTVSGGKFRMYIKPADGSANERELMESSDMLRPTAVSPDGKLLLYDAGDPGTGDVMGLPLAGGPARTIVGGPSQQYDGSLSPDGRWLLYITSDSNGRAAFLTPFPGPGGKWQVSNDTAYWGWWNGNGDEIDYLTGDGQVRSVAVSFHGPGVQLSAPTTLFRMNNNTNRRAISMTPDGTRFLVVTVEAQDLGPATLISNWEPR